jgi:hypothetical protein
VNITEKDLFINKKKIGLKEWNRSLNVISKIKG